MGTRNKQLSLSLFLITLIILSSSSFCKAQCENPESIDGGKCYNKERSMKLKLIAIFSILVSSMIGISIPMFSDSIPALHPDGDIFILVKALASGVILSTGFVHLLPESWDSLTSECLPESPWREFPVAALVVAVAAVGTMMMDTIATAFYKKKGMGSASRISHHHGHGGTPLPVELTESGGGQSDGVGHHELQAVEGKGTQLLRYRIVAQVLEMGIVVHSVIIGLSMGVSNNECTIRSLITAMCFHQLLEGVGLGGCILQAEYKAKMKFIMATFFSITTPFGIALGIGLTNVYVENSPTALIVVGMLNSVSSGLLIYMALVDLLAADFMGPKLQANIKLQLWAYFSAFIGLAAMSIMAKWA